MRFSREDKHNEVRHSLKTEEQSTCSDDEAHGDVEHTSLRCHHHSAVAAEAIPAREQFPLSRDVRHLAPGRSLSHVLPCMNVRIPATGGWRFITIVQSCPFDVPARELGQTCLISPASSGTAVEARRLPTTPAASMYPIATTTTATPRPPPPGRLARLFVAC